MTNICLVGYGSIGPVHARALAEIPGVRVSAVCDRIRSRAEAGAGFCGAVAYTEFSEALCDPAIDVFHILTPHYLHAPMIEAVLEKHKTAVCEKPLICTKKELDTALTWRDRDVFCIFQNRTNTAIQTLKTLIDTDRSLGALRGVKAFHVWHRDSDYYHSADWRGKKATEGGGVLINQALHTLDLVCYLTGGVRSVEGQASNHSLRGVIDVEDTVSAYLRFQNGATGLFFASNAGAVDSAPRIECSFEHALLTYENGKLFRDGLPVAENRAVPLGKPCWGGGHTDEFYRIYVSRTPTRVADVENTLRTLFAIYESADRGGKEVFI